MHTYDYTSIGLSQVFNQAKELLLKELERQQLLKQPASKLSEEWAFIVVEKGWLGKAIDKLMFHGENATPKIQIVKMLQTAEPERKKFSSPDNMIKLLPKEEK